MLLQLHAGGVRSWIDREMALNGMGRVSFPFMQSGYALVGKHLYSLNQDET